MGIIDELAAEYQSDPMIQTATGADTNYSALGDAGVDDTPILSKAAHAAMTIGHYTGINKVLGLTAEGLGRTDEAFRSVVLTTAGKIPIKDFPTWWKGAWDGEHKLQSRDFLTMLTSKEFMNQLDRVPVDILPKWTSAVIAPEAHLAGERPGKPTMGDLFAFSADFWATPFALGSLTPVGAGRAMARTAVGRGTLKLFSPFQKLARAADDVLLSPKSFAGGLTLMGRDPHGALPEIVVHAIQHDGHEAQGLLHDVAMRLQSSFEKTSVKRGTQDADLLGRYLANDKAVAHPEISKLGESIIDALESLLNTATDQGHIKWSREQRLGGFLPRAYFQAYKEQALPSQSWSFGKLGILRLPKGDALAHLAGELKGKNVDGWQYAMDVASGLAWKNTFNRKVWVEKQFTKTVKVNPLMGGAENMAYGIGATKNVTITKRIRVNDGSILKYRVWDEAKIGRQNPLLAGTTKPQLGYLTSKINDITGHSRGRWAMIENDWVGAVLDKFENRLQRNRVSKYIYSKSKKLVDPGDQYSLPMFSRPQRLAMVLTHNVNRAFLGGNLSYAVKNIAQVLNTGAVHGIPKSIKGIVQMNNWFGEGKDFAELRKMANVGAEFQGMLTDGAIMSKTGQLFDNIIMSPGRFSENWPRGVAFNIGAEEYAKKMGFKTVREAAQAGHTERMVKVGLENSWDQNFMYGAMGRPSLFTGPIMRPATTLLSYPAKQAEFWRRAIKRDGSAFIRGLSMQGWAIDTMNQAYGVNAESWLGWGFKPPIETAGGIPMIKSPQVEFLTEFIQGISAVGEGDADGAEKHFRKARGPVGQIFNQFDSSGVPENLQTAMAAGAQLGLAPIPIVAIAKSTALLHQFLTGEKVSSDASTFTPISKAEAVQSYFFQTQRAHNEQVLRDMTTKAKLTYNSTMGRRVKAFYSAANSDDGDSLRRAAQELATPIGLPGGMSMTPDYDAIMRRMELESQRRSLPREVLEMHKAGWLMDVYAAEYIDSAFRALSVGQ